jgi:hypothetical protein
MKEAHILYDNESPNVHPEYWALRKIDHEGLLSIWIRTPSYTAISESADILREEFAGLLMYNLRQKWKHGPRDCYWRGCSEYGKSGDGHLHIIFSFEQMRRNSKVPPNLEDFEEFAKESAEHIRKQLGLPKGCIDLHWRPVDDNEGLVSYFCKREMGRADFKYFFPLSLPWNIGEYLLGMVVSRHPELLTAGSQREGDQ